ncbi:hypothetical protein [Streptomyces sp. NPDC008125]|uniref:hypothetical protein n=1 Tax=Streptomyces sp. NPDC008125 TaxID=3364811 RepID=UPI0036E0F28C
MRVSSNMVPASVTAVSGLATVMAGAPWWGVIICLIFTLAATMVQAVFPQDSGDRLTWWTNHREHRHLRRAQRGRNAPPVPPA